MSSPSLDGSLERRWLTWANAITLLRIGAAPLCACAIAARNPLAAGLLFWAAVASDFADGRVARRRGEASPLGGFLDHATDAAFVSAGLAALAWQGAVPAPLPALVVAAFAQYALDSRALSGRPLRTNALGRWNGIAYYVLLGTPLTRDLLGSAWPGAALVSSLGWALVLSTLVSMAGRAGALLRGSRA